MGAAAIHLRDALALLEERTADGRMTRHSLVAYTYNEATREGGRRQELRDVCLLTADAFDGPVVTNKSKATPRTAVTTGKPDGRAKPKHFDNATRDLLLGDDTKHRVKIWLITEFNGQRVHW